MPFTEDLTAFLDDADFATEAVFSGTAATVNVIFDDDYTGPLDVESSGPSALGRAADFVGVVHGQTLTINAVAYVIVKVEPVKGMVRLKLREP